VSRVDSVSVLAPAKVNLVLDVLGRRADGYHEVDTVLAAIDLADVVDARAVDDRRGEVRLELAGPFASPDIPRDERNLVVRAVGPLLAAVGNGRSLALRLLKSVPSQAGLGGGSSDAAAALLAARLALGVGPDTASDITLLASLGSDTAFFAAAQDTGVARARGRGESIDVLPALPAGWCIALATPAAVASTEAVYQSLGLDAPSAKRAERPRAWNWEDGVALVRAELSNDLERAAALAVPELGRWRATLEGIDLDHWRLAGSGSTWFGLYPDERGARQGLAAVEAAAERAGLGVRFLGVAHPAGFGRRVVHRETGAADVHGSAVR